MTPTARRRACGSVEARQRLTVARAYLAAARHAQGEGDDAGRAANNVAVGNAVLAAVAAADAICCAALGERSRDQDHHAAIQLLMTVRSGSGDERSRQRDAAARAHWLQDVLDLKDRSHHGAELMGAARVKAGVRAAAHLIDAAEIILGEKS